MKIDFQYQKPEIVAEIEAKYPEMCKEYLRITAQGYETFCYKQSNYGPDNVSVGTTLKTEEEVKLSLIGLWFRKNDKIQRLKQLVVLNAKDNVGESIEDTYQDLSVYGIISLLVKRGKWAK